MKGIKCPILIIVNSCVPNAQRACLQTYPFNCLMCSLERSRLFSFMFLHLQIYRGTGGCGTKNRFVNLFIFKTGQHKVFVLATLGYSAVKFKKKRKLFNIWISAVWEGFALRSGLFPIKLNVSSTHLKCI